MTRQILDAMRAYVVDLGQALARFFPRCMTALLMLLVGWLIAAVARSLTRRLLHVLRFNELMRRIGATEFLERAELRAPDRIASSLVFWLVWFALLLSALRTLGVTAVDVLVADFIRYIPRLLSAAIIVVVGVLCSTFVWRAVLLAAVNARVPAAKLLGSLARALVLIAATAMALEQLAIGKDVILMGFALSFGAVMLSASIAFGLGGRHLARRYLEERLRSHKREEEQEPSGGGPSHL